MPPDPSQLRAKRSKRVDLLDKKIVATKVDDTRFLKGENILDSFKSDFAFGKSMTWFFDDNTCLTIQPVQTGEGEWLAGCQVQKWTTDSKNQMVIVPS
jgi:hypothetical protein